jgi:hypothetical protein
MFEKQEILKAVAAARQAAQAHINANPGVWYPCGFAWVKIQPARGRWVRAMKELGIGDKACDGGYIVYNPSNNHTQWMDAKEKGAHAFANALKAHGVSATVHTRID